MSGSFGGWLFGGVIVTLVGLLAAAILRHNLRVRRVRRIYQTLPSDVKEWVIRLIQQAAHKRPSVTLLRLEEQPSFESDGLVLESHVGGLPYAEAGEEWPSASEARFALQVRLDEPSLGPNWQERLVVVFLVDDFEQVVRSYAAPSLEEYVPLRSPVPPFPCVKMTPIPIPVDEQPAAEEDDGRQWQHPALPSRLCAMVPAMRDVLSPFPADPIGLLSQILCPNAYGYDLAECQIAYEGGDPMLIQNAHEAACDDCGKPMRFLFQFGEIIPGAQLGDGGVCYVYGCDEHPHCCKAFIDTH